MQMAGGTPTKEIIWHFTCKMCKGWWSIAASDNWKPKQLYCPHCGALHEYPTELTLSL